MSAQASLASGHRSRLLMTVLGLSALLFLSVLGLSAAAADRPLGGKALVSALRSGGYVILMRHASSPLEPPPAAQANPDNTQRERQLDASGRASARAMGDALRRLAIPVGQVLSSPTYRALETLRLSGLGPPQAYPELGDAGQSMQADTSGQRGAWLRAQAARPPSRGTNTLIVTHLPNISAAFPPAANQEAQELADGEALIFKPDGHGGALLVARVKIGEWAQLP